jgi:hypothetical protein
MKMNRARICQKETIGAIGFLLILLFLQAITAGGAQGDCGGPYVDAAICQFSREVDASSNLNATIWFLRQFNDSWMWEHNGTLTWVAEPNLAFWSFFYDELLHITAEFAPKMAVREVGWGLPVPEWIPWMGDTNNTRGFIRDYNNGSYYTTLGVYPDLERSSSGKGAAVENLTLVFSDEWERMRGIRPLRPEHWIAHISWNPWDAEWTKLAKRLAAHLNDTWYVESFVIQESVGDCAATWPFKSIILALLVLGGVSSKRRSSKKM